MLTEHLQIRSPVRAQSFEYELVQGTEIQIAISTYKMFPFYEAVLHQTSSRFLCLLILGASKFLNSAPSTSCLQSGSLWLLWG